MPVDTVNDSLSPLQRQIRAEYSSDANIRKYLKKSAGYGISYLLDHDYGQLYLEIIERCVARTKTGAPLRILEFGCGAGMNIIHLISALEGRGIAVESACGADLSEQLIEAARNEAGRMLEPRLSDRLEFCVARNEEMPADLNNGLCRRKESLTGSFDLILGVNTMRYSHRLENQQQCADGIRELLAEGGVCIVIDMNDRFPAFRSRLRRSRKGQSNRSEYLPSLDEYARPFEDAGLEILRKEKFCWIPHSAGRMLTATMRCLTPFLDLLWRPYAMRSLVVSRKPVNNAG